MRPDTHDSRERTLSGPSRILVFVQQAAGLCCPRERCFDMEFVGGRGMLQSPGIDVIAIYQHLGCLAALHVNVVLQVLAIVVETASRE